MKIRAISSDGDWVFGQGRNSYLTGLDALVQDVSTALQIILGEVWWDTNFGVDWFNLLGGRGDLVRQNLILQCREIVASREGVIRVESVDAVFGAFRRDITITYTVTTVFGRTTQSISKGVS